MNRTDLDRLADELRRQRDELKVKLHRAKADARDPWEALEKKWDHLRGRLGVVEGEAEEVGKDVLAALETVADELKKGYARIRKVL
jgi:hypothetical protein